jgi:Glycosyl transferase family 2
MTTPSSALPVVSVVVEGYNELQLATSVTDVLAGLEAQDYPLERVELILVGSEAQYREWTHITSGRFAQVVTLEAEGAGYYELKNRGAARARGEIVAFIDSDVHPEPGWLSAIVAAIGAGADATAGLSSFWNRSGWSIPQALLDAAASVSFGHVVGKRSRSGPHPAAGIVAHNMAIRAELFRSHPFRTDEMTRNCGVGLLYRDLRATGARVDLVPGQRVRHSFSPGWFVYPFHVRVGFEEHALRRAGPAARGSTLRRTGPLEPLLTAVLCAVVDLRSWVRFSRALGSSPTRRWASWPLVALSSALARGAGMVGGYAAMLRPERARAWAEAQ